MYMPRLSPGVSRGRMPVAGFDSISRSSVLAQQKIAAAPPSGCIDILYLPECHRVGFFHECCTTRHEVRCTECHSILRPPVFEFNAQRL